MKITKSQLKEIIKEEAVKLQKANLLRERRDQIVKEINQLNEGKDTGNPYDLNNPSNLEEFYNKIVEDLDADPLKYQNSFIQKDYISCTAYTAQWFSEAVNKDKDEISTYMRDIANHNGIAWLEARSHVSRL